MMLMGPTLSRSLRMLAGLCLMLLLMASPASARLGDKLDDVKKTDFFTFFNLAETGRSMNAGSQRVLTFQPKAGPFREFVKVNVTLAPDDRILSMELVLRRSFVDDGLNGVFARDIAKSLIRSAVPAQDEAAINDLANEIEFPKDAPGYDIARTGPDPKLPAQPTQGYLTYLGKRRLYTQTLSRSTLSMENTAQGGMDMLRISFSLKPGK